MLFVCDRHEVSSRGLREFNYEGLVDAAGLLSSRVDIFHARIVQPGTKFFLRSSRRGRLREKVTEKVTDRTSKKKKRRRER